MNIRLLVLVLKSWGFLIQRYIGSDKEKKEEEYDFKEGVVVESEKEDIIAAADFIFSFQKIYGREIR